MTSKMATVIETPIQVHRQMRDGWFVYTCDHLPGLYVASQDDKKAYNDLPSAISKLVKVTFGVECIVALKEEHAGFEDLALSQRASQVVTIAPMSCSPPAAAISRSSCNASEPMTRMRDAPSPGV